MSVTTDITIVGAGPVGLSIAAHLRESGLDFRIIGSVMHSWRSRMPKGMLLKSAGFASDLYDPARAFTLRQFCKTRGIPYRDVDFPVPLETFVSYGIEFQQRFVPNLEEENLTSLKRCPGGFELRMESGKRFRSRKVVLAVGIDDFRHIPQPLKRLPAELFSHSASHHDLGGFRGREVAVLGSGSSAIDIAVLLHESGAKVQHIVRKPVIHFSGPWSDSSRSLWRRIREPISAIGPGWRSRLCTDIPWLYRYLPDDFRIRTAKTHLGPSGGWFMKDRAAVVPILLGHELREAKVRGSHVQLRLDAAGGSSRYVDVDHVIAATGYRTDVRRLPFLSLDIVERLQLIGNNPRLSAYFESSVPGLYFAGPIAATSFGPVMRFAAGAEFASRRILKHLVRSIGAGSSVITHKADRIPRLY